MVAIRDSSFQHREQPVPHLSQDYPTYPTCSSCNLCILWCTSPNSRTLGGNSAWASKYTVFHCFSCRLSLIRLLSNFHITCKSEIQHSDIRQRETQEPCGIWWTQPHDAKSGTIGDIRGCHRMQFLLLDILDSPDLSSPVMSCAWGLPSYNLTLHEYGQNSPTHSVVVPNKLSKLCLLCFHLARDTGLKPSQARHWDQEDFYIQLFTTMCAKPNFCQRLKWIEMGCLRQGYKWAVNKSTSLHLYLEEGLDRIVKLPSFMNPKHDESE